MENNLKNKSKMIHIAIIILGSIFIILGNFHTGMWFDESYSVAIANHSLKEIWTIGGHDVHPVLYYFMLKIISVIFGGKNILLYRLFSSVALMLLGVIGYTHIRKDFGEKVGFLFSFFSLFLPLNIVYSGEIRMYTWGMLFVTIMAIYAYRIITQKDSKKNWIIFAIFSLASSYIHYYGLISAGIINLSMFIYFLIQSKKEKKMTSNLKRFIVSAIIQVALYIPWLIYFFIQLGQVSKGFWIQFKFPGSLIEMFTFQFVGNLDGSYYINNTIALIYGLVINIFIIYSVIKLFKKQGKKAIKEFYPAIIALGTYLGVIILTGVISIIMQQVIIYARYFLIITGLFIFFISFVLGKYANKYITMIICILTLIISTWINTNIIQMNYDQSNQLPISYMEQNLKEGDIFIYGNGDGGFGSGFVIAANFPEYTQYFYDKENWNVEEAYKAYAKTIYNLDVLENYHGRIWFIGNYNIFEEAQEKYNIELIDQTHFNTKYKNYEYSFVLANKE